MQQQAALGPVVVVGPDCMAAVARPAAFLPASILLAGAALTATSTRCVLVFGVVKKITFCVQVQYKIVHSLMRECIISLI